MFIAYLGLGSNLGNRCALVTAALEALASHPAIRVTCVSSLFETAPVGGPADQGHYLNAAVRVETPLLPDELLEITSGIERNLGRVRGGHRNEPRTIDIDILLHGRHRIVTDELTIPHPRMHERAFVLKPLAEIDPTLVHPLKGLTTTQMLKRLTRSF